MQCMWPNPCWWLAATRCMPQSTAPLWTASDEFPGAVDLPDGRRLGYVQLPASRAAGNTFESAFRRVHPDGDANWSATVV